MMNILIFSWRGPNHPNAGGAEISTHEHAKGWVKAGHNVILFTSAFDGCKREEIKDGVKIIRKGRQILGVQWEAFKWYLFGKHPDFDLVIDQFHGIPFFTPVFVKAKKIGFIHEVTKEVWKLNPWPWPLNQLVGLIGKAFEPFIFKLLYQSIPFMTVSVSTKKDLTQWGIHPESITVVYNGISAPKSVQLLPKEKKKTVIFLGAISKDKGIEDALEAFKLINNHTKDKWQFWVAGKSDLRYMKQINNLAKNLKLLGRVKFFGFVSEKRKFNLLSRAHVLINPSIREGWGLVVLEAAVVGTPTVGYRVSGLTDSVLHGKTGILCNLKPESCAQAIFDLIKDKERYEIMRRNCINRAKKFRWTDARKQSLVLLKQFEEH